MSEEAKQQALAQFLAPDCVRRVGKDYFLFPHPPTIIARAAARAGLHRVEEAEQSH